MNISFTTPQFTEETPRCAYAHDCRRFGMCRADRKPGEGRSEQAHGRGHIRVKALISLKVHHIHAHCLNDTVSADRRAKRHHRRTQDHQPDRDFKGSDVRLSFGKENTEQENTHEFLAVLRPMHKKTLPRPPPICP